jgi:hypothetical protein
VDVHEESAFDVLSCEAAKAEMMLAMSCHMQGLDILDFIEDNAAWLRYPEQPDNCSYKNQDTKELPV